MPLADVAWLAGDILAERDACLLLVWIDRNPVLADLPEP
jgi:hypothetical protein